MRDLLGLLALPDLWANQDQRGLLTIVCEAFEAVLPIQCCYAVATALDDEPAVHILRVRCQDTPVDDPRWAECMGALTKGPRGGPAAERQTPIGVMRFTRHEIGPGGQLGTLVLGSHEAGFPNVTQLIFLRAALGLAGSGLRAVRLAHEREKANRAKDEFLAMLGHELRNPLAPIVTALNLMKLRSGNHPSREQDVIERQVRHLSRLVDDLLDISRITRGNIELDVQPVEVADLAGKAVEMASPLLEASHHLLEVDVEDGLIVNGDPVRLAQVLANLLGNAAKFTPAGGRIALSARRDGEQVVCAVRDNGVGISSELLPLIFDLFYQIRPTIHRSSGGLGIGLAIVKTLVKAHGGTVSAHSNGEGKGSEFRVCLPLAGHAVVSAPAEALERGPSGTSDRRTRVLVVDDNHDAAAMMAELLEVSGYRAAVAHDGQEALSVLESFAPAVVVLDIGLPVMDGYETAERMRALPNPPRLIALTGYGQPTDRERSKAAGFEAHFVKPVEVDDLLAVISRGPPDSR